MQEKQQKDYGYDQDTSSRLIARYIQEEGIPIELFKEKRFGHIAEVMLTVPKRRTSNEEYGMRIAAAILLKTKFHVSDESIFRLNKAGKVISFLTERIINDTDLLEKLQESGDLEIVDIDPGKGGSTQVH